MGTPAYQSRTISAPYQAAIDRFTGPSTTEITPEARMQAQGAFHPSLLGVTDPVTSRLAGPSTAGAVTASSTGAPVLDALHAAIAKYYTGG